MTDNDDTFYLYVRYSINDDWTELDFGDDFNRHESAIHYLENDYQVSFKGE